MNLDDPNLQARITEMTRRFDTAPQRARDERDEEIRAIARDFSLRQVDLVRATGLSRETVRQALNPEARDALKASRRKSRPLPELATEHVDAYEAVRNTIEPYGWSADDKDRVGREVAIGLHALLVKHGNEQMARLVTDDAARRPHTTGLFDSLDRQGLTVTQLGVDDAVRAAAEVYATRS